MKRYFEESIASAAMLAVLIPTTALVVCMTITTIGICVATKRRVK